MQIRRWSVLLALLLGSSCAWAGTDFDLMDTENIDTLRLGQFRTTVGVKYWEQQDDSKVISPRFGFDVGIGPWAEFSARYDYRFLRDSNVFGNEEGSGAPVLRVKGLPWDLWGMKAGASFTMKVPSESHDKGTGSNQTDFFGRLIIGKQIARLKVSANLGVALLDSTEHVRVVEGYLLYGLLGEYELCDGWEAFLEFRGAAGHSKTEEVADRYPGDDWHEVRAGVQGPLACGFTWQLDGSVGLGADSPGYTAMFLISKEWGRGIDSDSDEAYQPLDPEDPCCQPVRLAVYDPLKTDVADTMGPKQARFGADFVAIEQADETHLYQIPRLSGGFGLGPWADFTLEDQVQYLDADNGPDQEQTGQFGHHVGLGSLFGKLRMTPLHGCDWRAGVILGGKLPIGKEEHGLSNGRIDVFGKIVLSVDLGDLRVHMNVGWTINDDNDKENRQNDFLIYGVAAEYAVSKKLTLVGEVSGSSFGERIGGIGQGFAGDNNHVVRLGAIGPMPFLRKWQWGVVGGYGLTEDSPGYDVLIGFSTLFGEVEPHHN